MKLILYIGFAQPDEWEGWAGTYARHARRFEEASGALAIVVPYHQIDTARIAQLRPHAVVMSGFARSFEAYTADELEGAVEWLSAPQLPTLALCGSHQLLGKVMLHGQLWRSKLQDEPMRRLRDGEPICNPDYHPEYYMERGVYRMELTEEGRTDPLFSGIAEPAFVESHYCELKRVPDGFDLLASTSDCRIQAMRRRGSVVYGLQFHPEDASARFPAGAQLLQNFFRTAGAAVEGATA
ncbi:MAG: gamma-glutamyl-gamma-aminobutyrate hydrolase family protein [Armatimonadetes bacterium]|nr:gamma-glutamyl-gamma-aminobutyrate hydrolase family protein [Armatimonadota bacterium]MDE2205392.1 gamma-glutamyl-gamma-aminobutyrate hydrolase family protein [Armatimonadota bacterium]